MKSPLVVLVVVGNVTLGLVTLGWVVQRTERSLFRYRMWATRDKVVRALISGEVESHPSIRIWIDRAEVMIAATSVLTPFHYVLAIRTMKRSGEFRPARPVVDESAPESVRALLVEAQDECRHAVARVITFGSPSGWLLTLSLLMAYPVIAYKQRRYRKQCDRDAVTLDRVAQWSGRRYGSPAEVFRPLVQRPDKAQSREPAYI